MDRLKKQWVWGGKGISLCPVKHLTAAALYGVPKMPLTLEA